jgi:hypothetical protein
VKLSLSLNSEIRNEETWGSGSIAPPFLTLSPDGCEWSVSHSCHFTSRERAPGSHWRGGQVSPRTGLDTLDWGKIYHQEVSGTRNRGKIICDEYNFSDVTLCSLVGGNRHFRPLYSNVRHCSRTWATRLHGTSQKTGQSLSETHIIGLKKNSAA